MWSSKFLHKIKSQYWYISTSCMNKNEIQNTRKWPKIISQNLVSFWYWSFFPFLCLISIWIALFQSESPYFTSSRPFVYYLWYLYTYVLIYVSFTACKIQFLQITINLTFKFFESFLIILRTIAVGISWLLVMLTPKYMNLWWTKHCNTNF